MNNINNYILEKLRIDKNIKLTKDITIPNNRAIRIIVAAFVAIMKDHAYKENSVSKKELYKGEIDFEFIISFLNKEFDEKLSLYDIQKGGTINIIVRSNYTALNNLINFYKTSVKDIFKNPIKVDDKVYLLDGEKLYNKYIDIIEKK